MKKKGVLLIGLVVLAFVGSILTVRHLGSTRIVAQGVAPNGVEFCIVQRWGNDFWNSSAYYRQPGGRWGWHYYDHDDVYWGRGEIEVDEAENLLRVYRNGVLTATFNYETEAFTLMRKDFPQRTTTGTDSWLPLGVDPWEGE